jgi:hypothetical protein
LATAASAAITATATIAKPVETLVNQVVLALLRKLEFKVLNFQSLFVLPVVVQSVDDTLSVVLTGAKNIALILLSLESSRREALRNRKAKVTLTIAEFGSVFTILEEQVTTEISNLALSLAAAVLQSLDNIAVTEVNSIDNTLSREANLTSNLLDSSLNIAAALLKSVEVNVKRLSQLAKSKTIALDGGLNTISILVVLQLSADSIELSLSFNTLSSSTCTIPTKAKASIAEQSKEHEVSKRIVHPVVHTSTHHGGHRAQIVSTVITVCQDGSCGRVVVVIAVTTIDFFYSFSHNLKNLES